MVKDYHRAVELLYRQVLRPELQDGRDILLTDLSGVFASSKAGGADYSYCNVDERLRKPLELDLRVVLTCEPGGAGPALSVLGPSGEAAGPRSSAGWGAQEFVLPRAAGGLYKVQVECHSTAANYREVIQVEVTRDFGRPTEKRRYYTVLLPGRTGTFTIADVYF